jgi:hypothetical protein
MRQQVAHRSGVYERCALLQIRNISIASAHLQSCAALRSRQYSPNERISTRGGQGSVRTSALRAGVGGVRVREDEVPHQVVQPAPFPCSGLLDCVISARRWRSLPPNVAYKGGSTGCANW